MGVAACPDYPQIFRRMVVRSAELALGAVPPGALKLDEEVRDRSLYTLDLALDLPAAWPAAQHLLLAISQPLGLQGYRDLWMGYLERGLAAAERAGDWPACAQIRLQLGWFYRHINRYVEAEAHSRHAYALALQLGQPTTQIGALDQLSLVAVECSDLAAAGRYVDEVFAITAPGDPQRAHSYSRLGFIALQHAEWDSAIAAYAESIRLHLAAGQHHFVAQAQRCLGFVYTCLGQYQQAQACYQRSLHFFAQHALLLDLAKTRMELGVVYWYLHEDEQALALHDMCEPVFVKTGDKVSLAGLYNNRGLVWRSLGRFEEAQRSFAASIALARELNQPRLVAKTFESLGGMYEQMGDSERAIAAWEQGLVELGALAERPQHIHRLLVSRIQGARNEQRNPLPDSSASLAA